MTKTQFDSTVERLGFVWKEEFEVWHHPAVLVYTWWHEGAMAISWDLVRTVYREATKERVEALKTVFSH